MKGSNIRQARTKHGQRKPSDLHILLVFGERQTIRRLSSSALRPAASLPACPAPLHCPSQLFMPSAREACGPIEAEQASAPMVVIFSHLCHRHRCPRRLKAPLITRHIRWSLRPSRPQLQRQLLESSDRTFFTHPDSARNTGPLSAIVPSAVPETQPWPGSSASNLLSSRRPDSPR